VEASVSRCDCEPIVYDDGSKTHEYECAIYPWCPHETTAATCDIPCGCQCEPCLALIEDVGRKV
jgi:hypothetical protein